MNKFEIELIQEQLKESRKQDFRYKPFFFNKLIEWEDTTIGDSTKLFYANIKILPRETYNPASLAALAPVDPLSFHDQKIADAAAAAKLYSLDYFPVFTMNEVKHRFEWGDNDNIMFNHALFYAATAPSQKYTVQIIGVQFFAY